MCTTPLTCLLNTCTSTGTIPEKKKTHLMVPVLKSGDTCRADIVNDTSESLLCVTSKVLEHLTYDILISYILYRVSYCYSSLAF